jgi:hypothetical protein
VPMFVNSSTDGKSRAQSPAIATFGGKFVLEAADCAVKGKQCVAKLLWRSLNEERLEYNIGLQAVDSRSDTVTGQIDYKQDCFQRVVAGDTRWVDTVTIDQRAQTKADRLEIVFFTGPEQYLSCEAPDVQYHVKLHLPIAQSPTFRTESEIGNVRLSTTCRNDTL